MTTATPTWIEQGWECHELPADVAVWFHSETHAYYRNIEQTSDGRWKGKGRLTGCSTVAAPFDFRPDSLMHWAARLDREGVSALASDGLSLDDPDDMRAALKWLTTGESIGEALKTARLDWNSTRFDAARRGTNVHLHALHALAQGNQVPTYAEMTDEERGYSSGVVGWWLDRDPHVLFAEQVVADLDLGVAGRLDLIYRDKIGQTVLADLKTSGYLSPKLAVQSALYVHCAKWCGIAEIDRAELIRVAPDGKYLVVEVEADEADVHAAVTVYRRSGKLASGLKRATT